MTASERPVPAPICFDADVKAAINVVTGLMRDTRYDRDKTDPLLWAARHFPVALISQVEALHERYRETHKINIVELIITESLARNLSDEDIAALDFANPWEGLHPEDAVLVDVPDAVKLEIRRGLVFDNYMHPRLHGFNEHVLQALASGQVPAVAAVSTCDLYEKISAETFATSPDWMPEQEFNVVKENTLAFLGGETAYKWYQEVKAEFPSDEE